MNIPKYVVETIKKLEDAGYEAYIVGGCVRDLLMIRLAATNGDYANEKRKEPKDWDITTNARPKAVQKLFKDSKYENIFGTVLLPIKNSKGETETVLEITTYRSEHGYKDHRHPDEVKFEDKLDKDLERRDFTVNAMAMKISVIARSITTKQSRGKNIKSAKTGSPRSDSIGARDDIEIIDLFGGEKDIKKKIIRGVGEPIDRFKEDALRMVRAIRFSAQLGFEIEPKTERAIKKMAGSIKFVANERIKDELVKILSSDQAYEGFVKLRKTNLLNYIIPELLQGAGVAQNHHHIYTVLKHSFLSLKYCPNKDWQVRMAALLHDIGKPKTKEMKNNAATFYNHEYAGERMVRKIMKRLKFSVADTGRVANLVRHHMFYYNNDEVSAASVRRLIKKVGKENLKDLIDIRIADRLGSATPKAKPYKLRHLEYMFERVQNDPISVKMLEINGDYMIEKLGFKPGIKMGAILDVLLALVIEDPKLNNLKYLEKRAKELDKMEAEDLRKQAKEMIKEKQEEDDKEMKKGYWVK